MSIHCSGQKGEYHTLLIAIIIEYWYWRWVFPETGITSAAPSLGLFGALMESRAVRDTAGTETPSRISLRRSRLMPLAMRVETADCAKLRGIGVAQHLAAALDQPRDVGVASADEDRDLNRGGLRHVCIAPGSRSTPLALAFYDRRDQIPIYSLLDERSAAYFGVVSSPSSWTLHSRNWIGARRKSPGLHSTYSPHCSSRF